jgi:hypothetical protein
MDPRKIIEKGKCCCCGIPLKEAKHLNGLHVNVQATWEFPIWGNLLSGIENMACAFTCDNCYEVGQIKPVPVKNVVEFRGNEILYHPVEIQDGQYVLVQ